MDILKSSVACQPIASLKLMSDRGFRLFLSFDQKKKNLAASGIFRHKQTRHAFAKCCPLQQWRFLLIKEGKTSWFITNIVWSWNI